VIKNFASELSTTLSSVEITRNGVAITDDQLNDAVLSALDTAKTENKKVMIIGNGGSAGISSHLAVDFWKNGGVKATAFNDSSLLTCISNDYSYEEVFQKPVEMFAEPGDILFAISSSGRSKNILNAVKAAKEKHVTVITLSGFDTSNPLRTLGDINIYTPHHDYGVVEVSHVAIIHSLLNDYIEKNV
jgi:D-sedoheptulose 7-phosphate isomerase